MARSATVTARFDLFVDRPGVLRDVDRWTAQILIRSGAYGRGVMRNKFRPPLVGKQSNSVVYQGRRYHVPRSGLVREYHTGQPVATALAMEVRRAFWATKKGRGAGQPPRRGPTDLLRKFTDFGYDRRRQMTVVGPWPFPSQPKLVGAVSVPELLDKGGGEVIGGDLVKYEPRPFVESTLAPTVRFMTQLIERSPVGARVI